MAAYTQLVAGELVREVLRELGEDVASGIAASGSTTTIVNKDALAGFQDADGRLVNAVATVVKGTNAGNSRLATAYTNSTGTLTVVAFGSAIDATSEFIIHNNRWTYTQVFNALKRAQRLLTWHPGLKRGIMDIITKRDIQIGNGLLNPVMDAGTTATAFDNWTDANSTISEETAITAYGLRRSAKVVTDGANVASFQQTLKRIGRWDNRTVQVRALVYCATASEVYLRAATGASNTDSAKHDGTGWKLLTLNLPAETNRSQIIVSLRTTTAASTVTFYVQWVWLPTDEHVYELEETENILAIDSFMHLSNLRITGQVGTGEGVQFSKALPPRAASLTRDVIGSTTTSHNLRFDLNGEDAGRIVQYKAYKPYTELTAATTTWGGEVDPIVQVAAAILANQKMSPSAQPQISNANAAEGYDTVEQTLARWLLLKGKTLPADAKVMQEVI